MTRPRRRGNGEGTVFHVPGRRRPWAASIVVGWTLEGRPIRRARYASSEREAKAMLLEMIAARETARPMPDDRMTVGKWLRLWISSPSVTELRPNSQEAYRYAVRLLLPELGNIPLRKLRSPAVEAALSQLPGGTNARAVLSTAIRDAMRAGHVQTNEAALARTKRGPRQKLVAPDTATVRAILDQLKPHRLHALYVLLAGTGLRIGEATGLRWEDVTLGEYRVDGQEGSAEHPRDRSDGLGLLRGPASRTARLRAGAASLSEQGDDRDGGRSMSGLPAVSVSGGTPHPHLTVRYQLQRIAGEHVLTDPKTDTAGRVVHLPPVLQAALRSHKARQNEERIRAGSKWRRSDLVFTTDQGEPIAETTAHWILSQAAKRAGTRHVSLHDLRRFAASELEDRLGRDAAQLVLGHASPGMTAQYVSLRESMLARAADAMQEAIG